MGAGLAREAPDSATWADLLGAEELLPDRGGGAAFAMTGLVVWEGDFLLLESAICFVVFLSSVDLEALGLLVGVLAVATTFGLGAAGLGFALVAAATADFGLDSGFALGAELGAGLTEAPAGALP